jgi:hypothetical protein
LEVEITKEIKIQFPNNKVMKYFCEWLCDAGGEECFFDYLDVINSPETVSHFQYHSENASFGQHDARRYGKFMECALIIVSSREDADT